MVQYRNCGLVITAIIAFASGVGLFLLPASSASAITDCPIASTSALRAADQNNNGVIDDSEVLSVNGLWARGVITDADIMPISNAWTTGCKIPSASAVASLKALGPLELGLGVPRDILGLGVLEDTNGDGQFTSADCNLLKDELDRNIAITDTRFDFNGDGTIGFPDVKACREMLATGLTGVTPGTSAGALIPIPTSISVRDSMGNSVDVSVSSPLNPPNQRCTIDWGDGFRFPVNLTNGAASVNHSYSQSGSYTIAFRCASANAVGEATKWVAVDVAHAAAQKATFDVLVIGVPDERAAANVIRDFVEKFSPFRELAKPWANIVIHVVSQPLACHGTDDCQRMLDTFAVSPLGNTADLQIGIPDIPVLAGHLGSPDIAAGIGYWNGSRNVVVAKPYASDPDIVVHEIGHAFGLYHVSGGCGEDAPIYLQFLCRSPNAGDCNEPNKNRDVMNFCVGNDHYGRYGYAYIADQLKPYLH